MTKTQKTWMTILILLVLALVSERFLNKETIIFKTSEGEVTVTDDTLKVVVPDTIKIVPIEEPKVTE